jgi:hypothetical protein
VAVKYEHFIYSIPTSPHWNALDTIVKDRELYHSYKTNIHNEWMKSFLMANLSSSNGDFWLLWLSLVFNNAFTIKIILIILILHFIKHILLRMILWFHFENELMLDIKVLQLSFK